MYFCRAGKIFGPSFECFPLPEPHQNRHRHWYWRSTRRTLTSNETNRPISFRHSLLDLLFRLFDGFGNMQKVKVDFTGFRPL